MPRVNLDHQLNLLHHEVAVLAGMVEKAVTRTVEALKQRDLEDCRQVIQGDDYIDQKRFEIEDRCVDLNATKQPMARVLWATFLLRVSHDLRRIADRATNIAEWVIFLVTGKMVEINVSRY